MRQFLRAGALATALAAIFGCVIGVWAFAAPFMQSDPPPFGGTKRIQTEDDKIVQLAQNFQAMQRHQEIDDQNALFLAQGFWGAQQASAENTLRHNPYDLAARQQLIDAKLRLSQIQRLLSQRH